MDEDTSLGTLATSHPLDPDVDEFVSKKVRVARNVLRIRGEQSKLNSSEKVVKFDLFRFVAV